MFINRTEQEYLDERDEIRAGRLRQEEEFFRREVVWERCERMKVALIILGILGTFFWIAILPNPFKFLALFIFLFSGWIGFRLYDRQADVEGPIS